MQTLLVTIAGPQKSYDLELPGDLPIYDLLPFLIELCFPDGLAQDLSAWSLYLPLSSTILSKAQTLIGSGIVDGAVLQLMDQQALRKVQQPERSFSPRQIAPGPGTGGIGVRWSKEEL
ncbi:EsaB/YukD family protein [Tengunoibacter tsumagoiensis]|uniref:Uncharacterized protein n=1 Tax=Tengunoibacter tsumagoiensis TaxID=2014871 RepID=A0A401ZUM9_9CHLR|nr:EsaB/YukD family protein [Tengunoibacter tsumagoiensis]GCE10537.1 hypothetical protein KTT_03960 [Tengunoibacter tsumagoiensis]